MDHPLLRRSIASRALVLLFGVAALASAIPGAAAQRLSRRFYSAGPTRCPKVAKVVAARVRAMVAQDPLRGPQLLRLLFHDCFVQGCDASILLDETPSGGSSEKDARPNLTVEGYEVVDDIKWRVERACPGTVSCADLLVLAAREALVLLGGPWVPVRLGRRDSTTAAFAEAGQQLSPSSNVSHLIRGFAQKSLTPTDLVALSGSHTVGVALCARILGRFNPPDSTLDPAYRDDLWRQCGGPTKKLNGGHRLQQDPVTPTVFDNQYYKNLLVKRGLLTSDSGLSFDGRTKGLVSLYARNQTAFFRQFSASFQRMSEIGVVTGSRGEIRKVCRYVNGKRARI